MNVSISRGWTAVCDTAKVRFFKQITTSSPWLLRVFRLFVILQKYDFSSKSQREKECRILRACCLWYCKSTIFQANHNRNYRIIMAQLAVCDTAKVRFFKQITTLTTSAHCFNCCLWYCKSTIFQANHNQISIDNHNRIAVCDTAKVRFFKQITTDVTQTSGTTKLFVILQKYDFSSKSQRLFYYWEWPKGCLWYCKSTIFQANHNCIFYSFCFRSAVCDTAKVRFFKQITTDAKRKIQEAVLFVILQKYDFSSKSQPRLGFIN